MPDSPNIIILWLITKVGKITICIRLDIITVEKIAKRTIKCKLQYEKVLRTIDKRKIKYKFGLRGKLIIKEWYKIYFAIYLSYP